MAAVREATSQKAREVAHPQLFRSTLKWPTRHCISHVMWPTGPPAMKIFFKHPRIRALWEQDRETGSY